MNLASLFQIGLDALLANKLRTVLTALGIIIGTASVITMLAIGSGAQASVEDRITSLGANTLTISPGSSQTGLVSGAAGSAETLTLEDYTALKDELSDQIKAISPEQSSGYQLIYREQNTNVTVTGVVPSYMDLRNYTLNAGSFFSDLQNDIAARVVVLGSTTATTLFPNTDPIGKQINIGRNVFTVVGVLNSKGQSGFGNADSVAFVPIKTSQRVLSGEDSLRSIVVQATSAESLDSLQSQITFLLSSRHGVSPAEADFTVTNSQDTLETLSSVSSTFTLLLAGIASISLLVGGIGIMNTMVISITERTREIGLRKAVGAKNRTILLQFLVEALVLSGLGAASGITLGVVGAWLLNTLAKVSTRLTPQSILLAAGVSVVIGLIFGIYPARKAAKLSPITALKFE